VHDGEGHAGRVALRRIDGRNLWLALAEVALRCTEGGEAGVPYGSVFGMKHPLK
jgi:hypothetical protein